MPESKVATLDTINSGAIADLFKAEFDKLLLNIADDNTEPDKVRSVTIKVTVKPTKNREMAATTVEVNSKLAPLKPNESTVVFAFDGRNVEAYVRGPVNQPDLIGDENLRRFPDAAGGQK
jgi:hypothetical protein